MGHAAVNDESRRDGPVLKHTFVTALDDAGNELMCGTIADLALRLVASASGALDLTEQVLCGRPLLNIGVHRNNYYHYSSPPCSVSNCPA